MLKKHGWRIDRFIHNYLYFRFYYPYVKVVFAFLPALRRLTWLKPLVPIGRAVFDRYHSKVLSASDTRKIFTLNHDLSATSAENKRIVPYRYATKILFSDPEFIVVMDCPCKRSAGAPDALLGSCLAVGRGIASFWLEHCQKYHARRISQEEALALIGEFRKKRHITQAFFKVATGGSTGVICNCHPDTCVSLVATRLARKISSDLRMNAESGYSVLRDEAKCAGCGTCAATCHFGAVRFGEGGWSYDKGPCLGCELCAEACPNGALRLYRDPERLLPLDLDFVEERLLDRPDGPAGQE